MISYQEPKRSIHSTLEELEERKIECKRLGALFFKKQIAPTIIYVILFVVLMLHNHNSFTMSLWIVETIVYCMVTFRSNEVEYKWDKWNIFYTATMVLLGVSTMCTTNNTMVVLNYVGFYLMLIVYLFHNVSGDAEWGLGSYLLNIMIATFGSLTVVYTPFSDAIAYYRSLTNEKSKVGKTFISMVVGFLCMIPFMIVLGGCLVSADKGFREFVMHITTNLFSSSTGLDIVMLLGFGFFSAYCGIRFLFQNPLTGIEGKEKKIGVVAPITFISPILMMYILFCGMKLSSYLIGISGTRVVEVARTGFFQLLFVCSVNFILVLVFGKYVKQHVVLNILLALFSVCTYIMIVSNAFEMSLYVKKYSLTFTRVFVFVALVLLSIWMLGATIYVFWRAFPIFKYSMVTVSIIYLVFTFAKPDYWIAEYNLTHFRDELQKSSLNNVVQYKEDVYDLSGDEDPDALVDVYYLCTLSLDAAPAMAKHLSKSDLWLYSDMHELEMEDTSFWHFNVARYLGQKQLNEKLALGKIDQIEAVDLEKEGAKLYEEAAMTDYLRENLGGDDARYVEYNGRIYSPYGTVTNGLGVADVSKVIAYYEDEYYKQERSILCTMTGTEDFLVLLPKLRVGYYDLPVVYRAVDTAMDEAGNIREMKIPGNAKGDQPEWIWRASLNGVISE